MNTLTAFATVASASLLLPVTIVLASLMGLFVASHLAYTGYASRQHGGRVNHDARFAGALAGVAFVALTGAPTDAPAFCRAFRAVLGWTRSPACRPPLQLLFRHERAEQP